MNCLICGSATAHYFSKTYTEPPFADFMREIGEVQYHRCPTCGFVLSKTHSELPLDEWARLNQACHHYFENPENERKGNQPPYAEQAMMINLLGRNGVIDTSNMIDYAAGYGTLSRVLEKYYDLRLPIFDPYVQGTEPGRYIPAANLRAYRTVINSAMFEHVLRRSDLDQVNRLVAGDGCLIVHTVVCEHIPNDPDWFYLRPPVHTAFHTNRSMNILMKEWGYQSSIYSPRGKCWVLLRKNVDSVAPICAALNRELQADWFFTKSGFVDYWKGF